jgi:murein DD-endopeptidase MepM/ murein hydrolase activator NlpD
LPLECGSSAQVTQGRGGFSHFNEAYYGIDFGLALNTPLVAMDDGVVSLANNSVKPGNPCYSGGGQGCANTVNYVVVAHADGTDTAYLHVNSVLVSVGQKVKRGDRIALSGGTGWSTGPHAHVQRQNRCGIWWCQSVAVMFGDIAGSGDTYTGQWVTSQNCQ